MVEKMAHNLVRFSFLFLLSFLFVSIPIATRAVTINFDNLLEGAAVTDQYADLGVIFSGVEGDPVIAEAWNGAFYAYCYGNCYNGKDDHVLSDDVSGGKMLTDALSNDPNDSHPFLIGDDIKATFTVPVSRVSFYLLDIDARETFTVKAYNKDNNVIAEQTVKSGDPGTGDGIATLIEISTTETNPIDHIILDVPSWVGFAIDDFSFTPVPEPATIFLLGVGLLGVAGVARKKRFFGVG